MVLGDTSMATIYGESKLVKEGGRECMHLEKDKKGGRGLLVSVGLVCLPVL